MSTTARTETKLRKETKKTNRKVEEVGKLSPTHSEVEERTYKVIDGEDIQSLAIKEEDLKKLPKPKPTFEEKNDNILVKKKNKNAYPTVEVKVAKLAPDRPVKPIDVSDNLGLQFDKYGNCIPHSILGTVEEFLHEAVSHGKSIELPYDTLDSDRPDANLYLKVDNNPPKRIKKNLSGDFGENALNNWKEKMFERKSTQNLLSSSDFPSSSYYESINRPIDDLVMNQSDKVRQYTEIKTLIDRTLPLVENGKGNRLGSEFWNQPILVGSTENGLHLTLNQSERGVLPPIEQISKPLITLKETDFRTNQPAVTHYPWDKSQYLQKRLKFLEPLIDEILPKKAEFEELQLVGKNPFLKNNKSNKEDKENNFVIDNTWVNNSILNDKERDKSIYESSKNPYYIQVDDSDDPLSAHPDIIQAPVFGPAVVFGGQTASWTGNDNENQGIVALESRLNFETKAGKRVLATFEIHNIGTTTIYYDWRRIPDANSFNIVNPKVQRFYFDTRSSSILPGDQLKLHVVFKSVKGGIFTEKWEFATQPQLLSGALLVLTLRGVAIQEDKYKKTRIAIEKKLFVREAEMIARNMVDLILSGVRTPDRCGSPQNAYLTEEEKFSEINPQFYYDHDSIVQLKNLYLELFDESERDQHEWNYSVGDFKHQIMSLDENDPKKQNLLFSLNTILSAMSFPQYVPTSSNMYYVCYNIICSNIDEVCNEMNNLKTNLNLPIPLNEDMYPHVDEFNNKYEEWKKEFEIFKTIEIYSEGKESDEKKNRQEKEKGKDGKGGKKADNKKDDKKKDVEKKKPTPVPSGNKSRVSREQISRSVSRNQDKSDDRIKTPVVLSEQQLRNREVFMDKAYVHVYQMLCNMVDNVENIFSEIMSKVDQTEVLSRFVNQPKINIPLNADFFD